jgi:hypothetical protein
MVDRKQTSISGCNDQLQSGRGQSKGGLQPSDGGSSLSVRQSARGWQKKKGIVISL